MVPTLPGSVMDHNEVNRKRRMKTSSVHHPIPHGRGDEGLEALGVGKPRENQRNEKPKEMETDHKRKRENETSRNTKRTTSDMEEQAKTRKSREKVVLDG